MIIGTNRKGFSCRFACAILSHAAVACAYQVLACKGNGQARVWGLPQAGCEVVSLGELTAAREQITTFRAEPGVSYIVVPHTGCVSITSSGQLEHVCVILSQDQASQA